MYVIVTCGVFVVGTQCNVDYIALEDIKQELVPHCQTLFCNLRENEIADEIKVESVCDTDPVVTALTFMDKFTDTTSNVVRKNMTNMLKDSIMAVYTKVYEREMMRKVDALRNQLGCH